MRERRHFDCRPESVTAARRWVRQALRDRPSDLVEAAELMTSELATNCVRHARTDFELSIRAEGEIRIEVRDTGAGRPTVLSPAPEEPSGRGLRIIEAMSDDWGIIPGSGGKAVWFTIVEPHARAEPSRGARPGTAGTQKGTSARPPLLNCWRWRVPATAS